MARTITLELEVAEAHMLIGPISDAQVEQSLLAAKAKGEEAEWASVRAQMLNRIAGRLVDQLMPDLDDPARRHIFEQEIELGML